MGTASALPIAKHHRFTCSQQVHREDKTMGYTHYFSQRRSLTLAEWRTACEDVAAILKYAQHECGIPLANGLGEPKTSPVITDTFIAFNGLGDDSHETLYIARRPKKDDRGGFCKTERKPYDPVVTAVLCYLSTATRREDPTTHEPIIGSELFDVWSGGDGSDFLAGLDLARKALAPRLGNELDLPLELLRQDRWCEPWVNVNGGGGGCTANKNFEIHFCVDGRGYVLRPTTGESYRFETHDALAAFLDKTKAASFARGGGDASRWGSYGREEPNIWNATGSFDTQRHDRIKRSQEKVLRTLFPVDADHAHQPPLYVRPGELPDNAGREFCYSVSDLLNLAAGA